MSARTGTRLFVGNLLYTTSKADIRALFSDLGRVVDVYTPYVPDKEGHHKGYAFVEMRTTSEARTATLMLNGTPGPGGRKLIIKQAKPRTNGKTRVSSSVEADS